MEINEKKSNYYEKRKKKLCRNLERWLLPNNIVRNFFLCCKAENCIATYRLGGLSVLQYTA